MLRAPETPVFPVLRQFLASLLLVLFASPAFADAACKAVSADGKPLSGAAKASYMKKCCETNAKSADGKPLSGAAKNSYVKKCMG